MSREKRMMNRKKTNNRNGKEIERNAIPIKEHITNIVSNKKLLITLIVTILVLVTLLSTSFAMLMKSKSSVKQELYETGILTVVLDKETEGNPITINLAKPISDEYGMATVEPYTFTIENTGTTYASYEAYLDETIKNDSLTNDEVRKYIRYQIDDEPPRSLAGQGSNIIVRGGIHPGENLTFNLKLWISTDAPNEMEGTEYSAKVGVKGKATNRMQPNGPELVDGLIPVVYNEKTENWVKADTSTSWYNYEIQKWANAVTVTRETREKYMSDKAGTTIDMNDINTMWVWIPRYKYNIPSNIGSNDNVPNPPKIDVIFESRYNTTGETEKDYRTSFEGCEDNCKSTMYYTHPAFRNGEVVYNEEKYDIGGWNKELTGIWISKFEISGTADTPIIKPNLESLNQTISVGFATSLNFSGGVMDEKTGEITFNGSEKYGLSSLDTTHMMKSTEWGAVAYLSQSRYGKMGNNDFKGENKEIYMNNSRITGKSGGGPSGKSLSESFNYNIKNTGTGASTSGTIYGIYDMSGGCWEYTMGNLNKIIQWSGFENLPTSEYYDLYKYEGTDIEKEKTILGDATWETKGWYNDSTVYLTSGNPWVANGGSNSDNANKVGIFHINKFDGTVDGSSYHVTLAN